MANGAVEAEMASDNKPYTTLQYSNGPGADYLIDAMVRPNLTTVNTGTLYYFIFGPQLEETLYPILVQQAHVNFALNGENSGFVESNICLPFHWS